ncbi:hypothetical protein ACS0TY_006668 [Phlomoides rotata]
MGLNSMYIGEILSYNSTNIGQHVVQYFSNHFMATMDAPSDYSVLDNFIMPTILDIHNDSLMSIPPLEEVKMVVFDMDESSSPGPDEFGGCFYRS